MQHYKSLKFFDDDQLDNITYKTKLNSFEIYEYINYNYRKKIIYIVLKR